MTKKEKHTCGDCGTTAPLHREQVPFGLGPKWAASVEALVYDCKCGRGVVYEDMQGLIRALAGFLIQKPGRLAADEIRFLREYLDVEAKDLSELLGVTPSQVSRWENGAAPVGQAADRLLRLIVAKHGQLAFDVEHLRRIGEAAAGPLRPLFAWRGKDGWAVSQSWRKHDRVLKAAV